MLRVLLNVGADSPIKFPEPEIDPGPEIVFDIASLYLIYYVLIIS